ncbi:hypothetical protein H0I23_09840 [Cellulophaga sp. HaHaR_3_176]|uniref:hypothetical protein n=1 Tax=Cellulophaga sp. HaHaR_3_176 TaxID=1942464 RepID=UPI001C1FF294|nr:hypothetical protein [Cellulophaga sp. HaHaR_3_176]QWX82767.1 hypothetical protein H0I23_09840 [Cellulophaga sp. HaHaR_3_176]
MVTFFSILFILIGINAALLLFSVNRSSKKQQRTITNMYSTPTYPLNSIEPKYQKAV